MSLFRLSFDETSSFHYFHERNYSRPPLQTEEALTVFKNFLLHKFTNHVWLFNSCRLQIRSQELQGRCARCQWRHRPTSSAPIKTRSSSYRACLVRCCQNSRSCRWHQSLLHESDGTWNFTGSCLLLHYNSNMLQQLSRPVGVDIRTLLKSLINF